ncbi:MAG: chemotaxis protein CheW [Candidatus Rokuibacteriota bacterium]
MTTSLLDVTASVRACVIAFEGELFALDVTAVREVVVFEDWKAVPLAPAHVIGIANLRGAVVPIVDARAALRLPARHPERRLHTLIVAADGLEAAIVVDGVVALEAFGDIGATDGSSAAAHGALVRGVVDRAGRPVPLLDAGRLLSALRPAPGE